MDNPTSPSAPLEPITPVSNLTAVPPEPTVPPAQPTAPVTPPKKSNKKVFIIAGIVILFLALIFGGALAFVQMQSVPVLAPTPSSSPVVVATPEPVINDLKADWETYTSAITNNDDEKQFTFQYPPDWIVRKSAFPDGSPSEAGNYFMVEIHKFTTEELCDIAMSDAGIGVNPDAKLDTGYIAGRKVEKYVFINNEGRLLETYKNIIELPKDYSFDIDVRCRRDYMEEANQILSTFKFIE